MAALMNALALADERAVIFYDQLDSGRSDHPNDPANWKVERFTRELDSVRRALGVTRWHVMGHGWGGTIALEYAARRPPELSALVLASPLVSTRTWIADADALRRELPANVQALMKKCDFRNPTPVGRPAPPAASICQKANDAYDAAFDRRELPTHAQLEFALTQDGAGVNSRLYRAMWGTSARAATGTLRNYDGEPLLSNLDGERTLFIAGEYDEARPVTLAGFAARVPHAQVAMVPRAAHDFLSDRPDESLDILRPWFWTQE